MGVWDDIGAQTGITTGGGGNLYAGLSPQQALERWYSIQAQLRAQGAQPGQMSPEGEILGSMENLAQQNPEAFRLVATGTQPTKNEQGKNVRQVFNPNTGQFEEQQTHGWFSHPESWLQLGLGAAMGAAAPAAIASGGGSAATGAAVPVSEYAGTGSLYGGAGGTLGTLGPAGYSGAAGTAAGAGGAAGGSTLARLAPYLISGGVNALGGYMGARASNKAAEQQLAYGRQAMDALRDAYGQQLGFYQQQRDVYSPYVNIGNSALGNLAGLVGAPNPVRK